MQIKNFIPRIYFAQTKEENEHEIKRKKHIKIDVCGHTFNLFSFILVTENKQINTEKSEIDESIYFWGFPKEENQEIKIRELSEKAIDIALNNGVSLNKGDYEIGMVSYELKKRLSWEHEIIKMIENYPENNHPYEVHLIAYLVERSIKL